MGSKEDGKEVWVSGTVAVPQGGGTGKAPGAMEELVPQVALKQQHSSAPSSIAESDSCRSQGDRQVDSGTMWVSSSHTTREHLSWNTVVFIDQFPHTGDQGHLCQKRFILESGTC